MNGAQYKKNALHMESVPLELLAETYGTPLYCYSATRIAENFDAWKRALGRVTAPGNFTVCYAAKANGNQAVLSLLAARGAGADVVSGGELARALKAGIPAKKIVYSGVGKTEGELEAAIRKNILQINVESESELEAISRIASRLGKTARVALRVNPDVDAKTHKKISTGRKEDKFGIDIDLAPALYDKARRLPGVDACGVAVHIGSQITTLGPYKKAYLRVAALVRTLRARGHGISVIDLGGGMGIRYRDETPPDLNLYALLVRDVILPLGARVIVEPGRSIVGDAGLLLSRVIGVKKGRDRTFVVIDAAMNDLLRPALYDAWHAVLPCRKAGGRKISCDVVGPVCETGDSFLRGEMLPPLRAGDLVAVMTCGAYGAVMSSTYNTRPLAGEVIVKGAHHAAVRRAQAAAALIARDIVPGWIA